MSVVHWILDWFFGFVAGWCSYHLFLSYRKHKNNKDKIEYQNRKKIKTIRLDEKLIEKLKEKVDNLK